MNIIIFEKISAPYTPVGDTSHLTPGTWHLTRIDDMHRREYERSPTGSSSANTSSFSSTSSALDLSAGAQSHAANLKESKECVQSHENEREAAVIKS